MPFYCDLKKSKIRKNVKVVNLANKFIFKVLVFIFYILGLAASVFTVLEILNLFYLTKLEFLLFSLFSLLFLLFVSVHIFYKGGIKKPKLPHPLAELKKRGSGAERINVADFISLNAFSILWKANKESKEVQVESGVLLELLLRDKRIQFIIKRMGIKQDEFVSGLNDFYKDKKEKLSMDEIAVKALESALMLKHERLEIGDILAVLSVADPYFAKVLFEKNLKIEDVLNIVYWETIFWRKKEEKRFDPDRLKLTGGIGKDWAMGYSQNLLKYAKDITKGIQKTKTPLHIISRNEEINQLEKILVKANRHNVILVGESGIGKRTIIYGLAQRISRGMTYKALAYRHIMELDVNFLLANAQSPGEIIARLSGILNDAVRSGNIILFIDGIQSLFGGSGEDAKVGAINAAQVIIPYLEHPELFFIATASPANYRQYIETKPAVAEKFEKLEVEEPESFKVIRRLEDLVPQVENQANIIFTYESLKSIVDLSDRFIYDKPFPEKAIDLFNEVAVYAAAEGKGAMVKPSHVQKVITQKTGVPTGEAEAGEKEKLLKLEEILHKRVIGQDEAIKVISNAMRRARAGVEVSDKPIGTFLFLGPTGVGKTETCKALAEAYFGSEDAMIRFDMSEFQDISGIHKLIGAPAGTPEARSGGLLTSAVRDNPFSLVLLDELEKAHPDILNLFLQVFDEGWLTDSLGRKIKFNNTIIIATSNAGANLIQEGIKQKLSSEELTKQLWEYLQKEKIFKPEFLNRFTATVTFSPLTQEQVETITGLLVNKLASTLEKDRGIFLEVAPDAVSKLARLGYDPLMGARPIQRVIQKKVEDVLAKKMLSGEVKRGDKLLVSAEDISEE